MIALLSSEQLSAMRTAGFFAERRARAYFAAFDRLMHREGGELPAPEDVVPGETSQRRIDIRPTPAA